MRHFFRVFGRFVVYVATSLLLLVPGCARRPANVPSAAIKVDGFFIECSVEVPVHANKCTIYDGQSGDVLDSGQFVLTGSGREARPADLKYAASDGSRIFLWDARVLYPIVPRADKLLENKLKLTAGGAAVNCGVVPLQGDPNQASDCAIDAFSHHQAFYTYGINDGGNHPDSHGVAWNGSADVMTMNDFDNSIQIYPCPMPVRLWKQHGWLTCTPSPE